MRGIERALGLSHQTFSRWLVANILGLPPFGQSVLPAQGDEVLELDELWSFVWHKGQKRWLWVALNRRTRQIVAFVVGDRSAETCHKLWQRIPYEYRQACSYSDFWHAYELLSTTGKHQSVGKDSGQTAHVERWNCTLRQRLARYVRKTLSFSKSDKFHRSSFCWVPDKKLYGGCNSGITRTRSTGQNWF
jgi:IS1 family transposase